MAGLAHFGLGFAAKRIAPKLPLGILLAASAAIDIVWIVLALTGIEKMGSIPVWSHGLLMSVVWSVIAAGITLLVSRKLYAAGIIGLLVFGHWVLDFITHPMGALSGKPLPPDLPLLFEGSPLVGLGLYNHSIIIAVVFDSGIFLLGLAIYIFTLINLKKEKNRLPAK